jgi:hypothetical protein
VDIAELNIQIQQFSVYRPSCLEDKYYNEAVKNGAYFKWFAYFLKENETKISK